MNVSQQFYINDGVLYHYFGQGGDVIIPEGITEIADDAFSNRSDITGISIPKGCVKIGKNAFENCPGLTHITIPEGVKKIGNHAFRFCSALTEIVIPGFTVVIPDLFGNPEQ